MGTGNIALATLNRFPVTFYGMDVNPIGFDSEPNVFQGDFLELDFGDTHYDVIITNPPFSLAMPFIQRSLELADHVVMLLRVNFLETEDRWDFMSKNAPDIYVLPQRPSFTPDGGTDATAYAWFHWPPESRGRRRGSLEVLSLTPRSERQSGVSPPRRSFSCGG